jgi:hypothetical protein
MRYADSLRPGETSDQTLERRMRESSVVEERVVDIYGQGDFDRALAEAGSKLIVLEIESDSVCQTGAHARSCSCTRGLARLAPRARRRPSSARPTRHPCRARRL